MENIKDNLYMAVNKKWLDNAVIPEGRTSISTFSELHFKTEDIILNDIDKLLTNSNEEISKEMNNFLKLYKQGLNIEQRDKYGVEPIKKMINFLIEIDNFDTLNSKLFHLICNGYTLPFSPIVSIDMKDSNKHSLYLSVAPTILPNKEQYYTEKKEVFLEKYREMAVEVLKYFFDEETSILHVDNAIKYDLSFFEYVKSSTERTDYSKLYNPMNIYVLKEYSNNINIYEVINKIFKKIDNVIVTEPVYFKNIDQFINQNTFELLKSWMIVRYILSNTSLLTENLRLLGEKYSNYILGKEKSLDNKKYCYNYISGIFSGVIGDFYAKKYFGNEAKKDVLEMVNKIILTYKKRLKENTWLKKNTIDQAINKLESMDVLIGYPEEYDEKYKKYIVREDHSYFDNNLNITRVSLLNNFKKINEVVDRKKWAMSPATVNAYYHPTLNLICFPAAILQEPFYNFNRNKSSNYGSIGAVIAHEISHAFDNNGAKFDKDGNLNNWWDDEDFENFNKLTEKMVEQFDNIPYQDGFVNGKLTVSENIADLGGLSCALDALKELEDYSIQNFFISWAKSWAIKSTPEYTNLLLSTDVHAPAELRANMQPKNIDDFYTAFGINKDDKMYLEKEKRLSIW
ncbi:M13 family metallopeptidase [Streptobacillus felis]|uniref:M13 family metallopeptidase n=1 Tax=Streptobacillus felis TaxID=1384509 RepID=A0A7Z0PG10_9FUSO|nr:M13 family metallopeptidase [Streptobacillus felis]NYV28038.1 M13 family metallopeptidase [Streptobacillus felis]